MRANLAKNCLIVALMSLELGYGSILERYQQERSSLPILGAVSLTEEELFVRVNEPLEMECPSEAAPAAMPPPTRLSGLNPELLAHNVGTEGVKGHQSQGVSCHVGEADSSGRFSRTCLSDLVVGLLIGQGLTSVQYRCSLNLWSCML